AGTEMGVTEPQATFSPCFGGPFLVWHPSKYAELLAEKMRKHKARVWLVNTGWAGGAYGTGKRISLKNTRAIIDAIHCGALANVKTTRDPVFGFEIVAECPGVPSEILRPRESWADKSGYDATAKKLAGLFNKNFESYAAGASAEVKAAAPMAEQTVIRSLAGQRPAFMKRYNHELALRAPSDPANRVCNRRASVRLRARHGARKSKSSGHWTRHSGRTFRGNYCRAFRRSGGSPDARLRKRAGVDSVCLHHRSPARTRIFRSIATARRKAESACRGDRDLRCG